MTLPDVTETISDGGLGATSAIVDNVQVVLGVSSAGTAAQPKLIANIADLISSFGYGPGVDAAAMGLSVGRAPVLFTRTTGSTAGTSTSVTHSPSVGTSVMTVTGTPYDSYDAIVKVVVGGTIASTPSPQVQVSFDGGVTYSGSIRVTGTAPASVATFATQTGLTLVFAAGTLVVDETYTFTSTEPKWGASDATTAISSLASAADDFSFLHLVGKCSETEMATIAPYVETLSTTNMKYTSLLANTRDFEGDSESTWRAAVISDYNAFDHKRIAVCAGAARFTSLLYPWVYRRPISFAAAARACAGTLHEDLGRVKSGSIAQLGKDLNGISIYHDETANPGLDAARFITTRSIVGLNGAFFTQSPTFAPSGSDFYTWPNRRVMDLICRVARAFFLQELNDSVLVGANGFILEKEARDLEQRSDARLRDAVLSPGHVSAIQTLISRSDNILATKTLTVNIRAIPVGYKKFINITLGFVNPAVVVV